MREREREREREKERQRQREREKSEKCHNENWPKVCQVTPMPKKT
jgi:hypothetical protein